jgi:hypothetical protein
MQADEERINKIEQRISRLYHDNVGFYIIVELMRAQNVSVDVVKPIYDKVSAQAEKLMTERFHYYAIERDVDNHFNIVDSWTSRYLFAYCNRSPDPVFHEITIFDVFNDKSM